MRHFLSLMIFALTVAPPLSGLLFHHELTDSERKAATVCWQQEVNTSFNELIVSFNALRPERGSYHIRICIKTDEWSDWFDYADWAKNEQRSFSSTMQKPQASCSQDTLEVKDASNAVAFRVEVQALNGSDLSQFYALFASCADTKNLQFQAFDKQVQSVRLDIAGVSQMALNDVNAMRLCSPCSTTSVVSFLTKKSLDPLVFAQTVYDSGHDIYGNWMLNIAESFSLLGPSYRAWVERLDGFETIYKYLVQGIPSVVSVRGTLDTALKPYNSGHLIAVIGYNATDDSIICMDPCYPTNGETIVAYPRDAFLQVWKTRGQFAYLFQLAWRL